MGPPSAAPESQSQSRAQWRGLSCAAHSSDQTAPRRKTKKSGPKESPLRATRARAWSLLARAPIDHVARDAPDLRAPSAIQLGMTLGRQCAAQSIIAGDGDGDCNGDGNGNGSGALRRRLRRLRMLFCGGFFGPLALRACARAQNSLAAVGSAT